VLADVEALLNRRQQHRAAGVELRERAAENLHRS